MTLATTMFYTGFNPYTDKKVFVARSVEEKRKQKNYFFWWNNANPIKTIKKASQTL
jgi:hypothetical protein